MSVHDARPGDVYVDADGKLWRVVSVCDQPSVTVEEIERDPERPPLPAGMKIRRSGGVSGLMWQNYERIWKNPKAHGGGT